jgi:hypothetical protein
MTNVIASCDAFYLDGYGLLTPRAASLFIYKDRIVIVFRPAPPLTTDYFRLDINLDFVRSLKGTFVSGTDIFLAIVLKENDALLAIGFADELGLVQNPTFKMSEVDVKNCYTLLHDQIRLRKLDTVKRV